jgi:hypothetical protein
MRSSICPCNVFAFKIVYTARRAPLHPTPKLSEAGANLGASVTAATKK